MKRTNCPFIAVMRMRKCELENENKTNKKKRKEEGKHLSGLALLSWEWPLMKVTLIMLTILLDKPGEEVSESTSVNMPASQQCDVMTYVNSRSSTFLINSSAMQRNRNAFKWKYNIHEKKESPVNQIEWKWIYLLQANPYMKEICQLPWK